MIGLALCEWYDRGLECGVDVAAQRVIIHRIRANTTEHDFYFLRGKLRDSGVPADQSWMKPNQLRYAVRIAASVRIFAVSLPKLLDMVDYDCVIIKGDRR